MVLMRTFFMVCVPLFMVLTGYLMGKREIAVNLKYFFHLSKVLLPYFLITCVILCFKRFYLKDSISVFDGVLNILSYSQYSWYVELYIGLYMLIPFLNMLWKAIRSKRDQHVFLVILLIMTILPSLLNSPYRLVPGWWAGIYPITYYYLGVYFNEHQTAAGQPAWKYAAGLILCVVLFGSGNYWHDYGNTFSWGIWCDWNGYQTAISTVFLFLFLNAISLERLPALIKRILCKMSKLSFGAYISSWLVDQLVYPILNEKVPLMVKRLNFYLPTVLTVCAGA